MKKKRSKYKFLSTYLSLSGRYVFLSAILLMTGFYSHGQEDKKEGKKEHRKEKAALRKEKRQEKIDQGKMLITPMIGPSYTPELQFTLAGLVMISFKTNSKDTLIQRSSAPINIGGSSTGAFFVGTKLTSFWKQDKYRIYADLFYKKMPDNYYGVGFEQAFNTPKSDSTTKYTRAWFWFYPTFLFQFKKNQFVGPGVDVNYTKGSDPSDGVASDPYYQKYNDRPLNVGLGAVYQYDSRDIPINAWKGWFLQVKAFVYSTYLGGDNNYGLFEVDYRNYFKIKRDGRTLAIQARTRLTSGDVPYGEMSQIGTPFDLRGYHWGQYRHQDMLYFISEYRHQFIKKNGSLSKSGFVTWVGIGSIGEVVADFTQWLPNAGFGYRFEVQPRMNVRLDIGFGRHSQGIYFNINEAF